MHDRIPTYEENVRRKVLLPLGVTLIIFLILFLAIFQVYLNRQLSYTLEEHVSSVNNLYKNLLFERSRTMQSLIGQLQKNRVLQEAMQDRDRERLFAQAGPIFRELLRQQDITHFYFHDPEGVNFLRVHKSDRHGDLIDRLTMKQARSGIQMAAGAEMGPLGTFTLRVVIPWFVDNVLIGFIELGEEIEPLLEQLTYQTGSQMVILINKTLLDRAAWEVGQEMLGRGTNWDYLSDYVVTALTEQNMLGKIPGVLSEAHLSGHKTIRMSILNNEFRGRFMPLIDTGDVQVGVMMVLLNAEPVLRDHGVSTALVTVFCILLGGALFLSAYSILGRTEQNLESTRSKLVDEIENTHKANIQLGLEIGERRSAEQALKEAHTELEQRVANRTSELTEQKLLLENLVTNIPSFVAWKSLDRAYIGCNSGYAFLAGTTEEEIVGKIDADLDWSSTFRLLLSEIDELVLAEHEMIVGREIHEESPTGNSSFLCSAVPLHDANSQVFGMVSIFQNITEQREKQLLLEQTLIEARQSKDQIVGMMRSVDDALFVVDAEDRILLLNESAAALLRLDQEEVLGKEVARAIWLEALRDKVMEALRKREGGTEFDFEVGSDEKGSPLIMQARSSSLIDPQGRYEGMVFLARDVTRDRSMDRLKSDFISVAAHELRTPLATILGFSELLLDDAPNEEDRVEYVRAIYEKTDSLSRLLDDMLDISRIESGHGLELFAEKVQVEDLIMPVVKQYQKRETRRAFDVALEDTGQLVLADPDKIAQVLENLLSNAVKYSDQGGHIEISGKSSVNGYLVSVSDQGIGMTPEQVKHAFDKFYRGDTADKAIKGTGIGLTIVKHIIEEHEGTVSIESRPGKGSRVSFTLPIV